MRKIIIVSSAILCLSFNSTNTYQFSNTDTEIEVFSENGGRVDWCAANNTIVIDQENDGRWDIFTCNPDKSNMKNLTEDMTGEIFGDQMITVGQHRGQPAFSYDGKYILFQVMNEHASVKPKTEELLSLGVNNDLYIMHSDGSNKQKLTNNPAGWAVLHPHFSYDGKSILWAEKYKENKEASIFGSWRLVYAHILIDSAGQVLITSKQYIQPSGERWHESHGFSKDDSEIYFSGNLNTDFRASDIYAYTISDKTCRNISNSSSTWEEMYNVNPKNEKVYSYISSSFFKWNNNLGWATLRTELFINDNGITKQLTFYNQPFPNNPNKLSKKHYFIGDHCWSPDGKYILAVLAEVSIGKTTSKIIKIKVSNT